MTRRRRALALALVAIAAVASLAMSSWPSRWLCPEDPRAPVDAAVVFAGDPEYERTDTAARMVLAGEARLLIVTGGYPGPGDSAESLRRRAILQGVPPEVIHSEEVSWSTRECVLELRPLLMRLGVRRAAVVTSPFHQRRAGMAARAAWSGVGIEVLDRPARSPWRHVGWWRDRWQRGRVIEEYVKLLGYGARGWLALRPRELK
ncbi:MAG: YdcF family protein [Vicinamibacteria bacterium]|nr:YdcF family protein [Vicinamibacteria bacterium]